jgi:RNA polymerase sigma-70 factor (ECF subfamily)
MKVYDVQDRLTDYACKMQRGDLEAGEKIFDYYSPKIFRFVIVRVLNREIAEDLTQEVFLKVVNRIETFIPDRGSFSAWIWQITKNTLKDHYAKKKTIPLSDILPESKYFIDKKNNPDQRLKIYEVLKIAQGFSEEEQEIFSLRYLSDLSYKNLSEMTGKSEVALRVVVHRLNKKIRKALDD